MQIEEVMMVEVPKEQDKILVFSTNLSYSSMKTALLDMHRVELFDAHRTYTI